jgi:hypothetical protein
VDRPLGHNRCVWIVRGRPDGDGPAPRTARLGALSGFAVMVLTSVGFAVAGVMRWRRERDLDDDEEEEPNPDDDQADDDQTRLLTAS